MRENVNISNNSNGLSWSQLEAGSKWEVTSMWLSVANTLRYYHHFLEFHPTGPSHPRLGLITHTHNPDLALRSSCGGRRTMSLTTSASLNATGNEITLDCGVTFSCSSSKIQDRELRRLSLHPCHSSADVLSGSASACSSGRQKGFLPRKTPMLTLLISQDII